MFGSGEKFLLTKIYLLIVILTFQSSVWGYVYKHRIPIVFFRNTKSMPVSSSISHPTASNFEQGAYLTRNMRLFETSPLRARSFVQDELRPYAMKLHTRDQAPREGEREANKATPFTKWKPTRQNYLQFLVDSLRVYETFEHIINTHPRLQLLRNTGLERAEALKQDIQWMLRFDPSLILPECGEAGHAYARLLEELAKSNLPRFVCHYYNFYFAHTAGGRMIGAKMADILLNGVTLQFFQWKSDVKTLIDQTKKKIDELANIWNDNEKKDCLEETLSTFHYGESLMMYLNPPRN